MLFLAPGPWSLPFVTATLAACGGRAGAAGPYAKKEPEGA